jgi:5-methylcytosine-specific restriction endonuclease McrA
VPKGVYQRTDAHRLALQRRSNNPTYRKALSNSWTTTRRKAAQKKMTGRPIPWAPKIAEAIQKKYTDPEYLAKQARHRLTPLEKSLRNRLKTYIYSCSKDGRTWALADEEARTLFAAPCHYCGHIPEPERLNGIDRRDNGVGYLQDNVVPCCGLCNRNKGPMLYSDFLVWIRRVAALHQ